MGPDADLTDLDEASLFGQGFDALADEFLIEAVQHHIDPTAIGCLQNLVGERGGPRVVNMLDPQRAEEVPLPLTGGGVDLGTDRLSNCHGRLPHAAGRRMDQHLFALPQLCQADQTVMRRQKGQG